MPDESMMEAKTVKSIVCRILTALFVAVACIDVRADEAAAGSSRSARAAT